jgi:hypothetical protein
MIAQFLGLEGQVIGVHANAHSHGV